MMQLHEVRKKQLIKLRAKYRRSCQMNAEVSLANAELNKAYSKVLEEKHEALDEIECLQEALRTLEEKHTPSRS